MKCLACGSKMPLLYNDLFDDRYGAPGFYSIYRCRKCGFGRTDPVLEKAKIGGFYKKYYPLSELNPEKVKSSVNVISSFWAWLFGIDNTAHRHIQKNKDVLDVGSGSGVSLLEIEKMGANAFGVEPDPNAQKIAKKLNLKVFKGFLTENPYPRKKFDFITASQVIEHEPDPFKFLVSAKKKLRDNGQIILSFPNFDSVYRKIFGREWLNWHVPYHINFFNLESVKKLVKKTGLQVTGVRTITPNVWTIMQIRSLISKVNEGKKNAIWTSTTSRGNVLEKPNTFKKVVSQIILFAVMGMITIVNRLVDLLGLGDSLFVILKNVQK